MSNNRLTPEFIGDKSFTLKEVEKFAKIDNERLRSYVDVLLSGDNYLRELNRNSVLVWKEGSESELRTYETEASDQKVVIKKDFPESGTWSIWVEDEYWEFDSIDGIDNLLIDLIVSWRASNSE